MEAPISCLDVENWATEYAEGVLGRSETRLVDEHLAECAACRAAMQEMRQALALCRKIDGALVPAGLVQRILEETSGTLTWRQRLHVWLRPVLEPRVALGLAAALISASMILHATGADVSKVRLADLSPIVVYKKTAARVSRYYNDIRVVYEIQSQLQAIRDARAPQDPKQNQPPPKQPQPEPAKPRSVLSAPRALWAWLAPLPGCISSEAIAEDGLNKWLRDRVYTGGIGKWI